MPSVKDYWFVTRPKRKLNAIPEELAAFCTVALGNKWTGNRELHIKFEEELENSGTKRIGERRDGAGSGGRTHAVMLYSLGLWFEKNDQVFLTLAGEAIMSGKSPVEVLKKQVLRFQYPSVYSVKSVSSRFKVHPYVFLLRLLADARIEYLSQEEIAFIVLLEADSESEKCFEYVADMILQYREKGKTIFAQDRFKERGATEDNLMDVANTMMNWIDYTQLVYRANVDERKSIIGIEPSKMMEVRKILGEKQKFFAFPAEADVFQRQYGIDPWHQKDTRNLLNSTTISSQTIDRNRILKVFFNYSSTHPVKSITSTVVEEISRLAGTRIRYTEQVLTDTYPHGALGGYLSEYRNMAFQGRDEAIKFEEATTNLFKDIFGYTSIHLGQTGAKSAPDVLLISDPEGYQAIIDNKAYSKYSITGDHHNRMVHNYIEGISNYSDCSYPIGFFTYISGGFVDHIDNQIKAEVSETNVHGSAITVSNLISLIEKHNESPYSHKELRRIFGLDRQIELADL